MYDTYVLNICNGYNVSANCLVTECMVLLSRKNLKL